jgi:hypothetical protein
MNVSRSVIATGERAMPPAGPDRISSDQISGDQIGSERLTSFFRQIADLARALPGAAS